MSGKQLWTSIVIFMTLATDTSLATYDVNKYCQLVPGGTRLPSFKSCQVFYTCHTSGGYSEVTCMGSQSFDKDSQACKPSSSANCYYDLKNPCAVTTDSALIFAPNPQDCQGYIVCQNKLETARGSCPNGQIFDAAQVACVYGTCSNSHLQSRNLKTDVEHLCDIMPAGKFFGDFEKCSTWHMCSKSKMYSGSCLNGLVYNAEKRMCLTNNGQMCSRIETPLEECDNFDKGKFKGDKYICSVYYQCDGLNWHRNTCPTGQYFDLKTNTCMARQLATPEAGCDRCQYTTKKWVNAVHSQCETYQECSNGFKVNEGTCGPNAYYHEDTQVCLLGSKDLDNYRAENGACYGLESTSSIPHISTTEIPADTKPTQETSTPLTTPMITTSAVTDTTTTTTTTPPPLENQEDLEKCHSSDEGNIKSDPNICSLYYKCNGVVWLKQQCPSQQYYDVHNHGCTDRQLATPIASCDRCEFSTTLWVNSVDPQCKKYTICKDGQKFAEDFCRSNGYFHEEGQGCTVSETNLLAFREKHGACKN